MKKILQVATTGALMATMGVAMASDSMNGIQLSDKGLTLSINGTAFLTVPNDEAQMNWSAMAQASTLQEATSQAVKAMNKGLSQIKAVSDQLQLQTQYINSYPVYGETKGNQTPKIVAWRVTQSLQVIAPDVTLVPKVIESVNGELALDGLNFRVSDTAKAKYDESSKVQLQSLRFSGSANPRPLNVMMAASAKSARDAAVIAPQLEAGTSDLNLTVSAEVLIKR